MGWAAGSEIAEEVWGIVREYIPAHKRRIIAKDIIEIFEDEDADAWDGTSLIEEDADHNVFEDEELKEEDDL